MPTYTIFSKIGWVGTWLPLLVPTFFANAFDVFLIRQYMMTIPRDMDEAASIDGAGPFRTLISVILPQVWPAVVAVAIFHLVYSWNDFFDPLIYLSTKPELQTLAVGLQKFNGIHYRNPAYVQAGTLMTMVIPVILFLVFQRVFVRGVVSAGWRSERGDAASSSFRVALTFDAEHPDRPHRPGVTARPAGRAGRARRPFDVVPAGPVGGGRARPRAPRRRRGPPRGEPQLLSRPHAAPDRRRAGDGHARGRGGHPRRHRRGPAAVVPVPVLGG